MSDVVNHLKCTKAQISDRVLLPGDPKRAEYICEKFLKNGQKIAQNREFLTCVGNYNNKKVTVTSTGIGCPSTAIAVEELIDLGVKYLIRVGTCGGALKKEITPGYIIIPTASVREEGTTKEYVRPEFPAVADFELIMRLKQAAEKRKYKHAIGINRTHDAFYGNPGNLKSWAEPCLRADKNRMKNPIISSEMEAAALFVISSLRGVKAAAVLAVNSHPEDLIEIATGKMKFDAPGIKIKTAEAEKSVDRTILTALDAITSF